MKILKHIVLMTGLISAAITTQALPILTAPATIANTSLFINVTNSTGLLSSTGFKVIVVDSTGLAYADINAGVTTSGLDVYVPIGASASLILTDDLLGILNSVLNFTGNTLGTFGLTNLLSTQSGTFAMATNNCPVAISGQTVSFSVTGGGSPLGSSGSFSISNSLSDKKFSLSGGLAASGNYTYSNMNMSTALWQAVDTNNVTYSIYMGFTNGNSGTFALKISTGGYQTGNFSITNNYPNHFFNPEIPLGQGVYWLQFTNSTIFGYYNLTFYPYIYHYDMGWSYFTDANDGLAGCYLYDFTSQHFFYTNPSDWPNVYDFAQNAWLFYCPSSTNSQRYSSNPRYFYKYATTNFITE